jgi:hypothetical protein
VLGFAPQPERAGEWHPPRRDIPSANVYDLAHGKIKCIRIFLDRQEALEAVGLSEQDARRS